jgi:hypothetical protein
VNLKIGSFCLVLIFIISLSIKAQDRGFGIGFIVGEPTGLSYGHQVGTHLILD